MKKTPPVKFEKSPLDRRRWLFLLWGAVALALVWRLITAWEIAAGPFASSVFMPAKATDLRTYMDLAREITEGNFSGPFYYQPFYYSVFLVVCRWIFNGSVWGVVIVQALLGSATVLLAGLCGRNIAGRIGGITAAYLTAFCNILIFYTPFHQIATLQTFNLTLLTYLSIRACRSGKLRFALAVGAAAAVGALTRGNILLVFLGLLAGYCWIMLRQFNWRKALVNSLLMIAVFLAVESPFIIYNSLELGRLSGPSTAADAVLALGNTPEAPAGGRDPGLPAGPMEYPQAYHIWMADCDQVPVFKKILAYLTDEPAAYLELTFRKALLFWDCREIPNNVSMNGGEGLSSRMLKITLPAGVIIALGLAGMFVALKKIRKNGLLMLYITVICYWGATALFYNLARFRAPLLPVLAVWGGLFVAVIIRRSRQNDWNFIRTCGFLSLALGAFITLGAYEFYRTMLEKSVIRAVRPNGTVLTLQDKRCVQFYHGPRTFGGWRVLSTPAGTQLRVKFPPAMNKNHASTEIQFSVQSARDGVLVLDIAGVNVSSVFKSPEFKEITVRLKPEFAGDTVPVKVLYNSAEAGFIADFQRDYGATELNGELISAETVMRMTR